MKYLKGFVRIMSWSPVKKQPWYFHLFHSLWTWSTVILLMLSMPSWLGHTVAIGDSRPDDSRPEADLFDYNSPIPLNNGMCMVIATREQVAC